MQTYFPGHIRMAQLRAEVEPFFQLLEAHGIQVIAGMEISFQAWSDEGRAQVWGEDGRIHRLIFEPVPGAVPGTQARVPEAGLQLRFRSNDEPFNPIALAFGHDD
jgi:hypothetical protein